MSAELPREILDYDVWLANALSSGEAHAYVRDPDLLREFVIRFNREIDATILKYGDVQVAAAIWFVYGCVSGYMHDVLAPSVGNPRLECMESVKTLYAEGFDRHCVSEFENQGPLNTACYMLWDMDSIECPAHGGDAAMTKASLDVLGFALSLENPACHLSALHGLGHLVPSHRSAIEPIIRGYLRTKRPVAERNYALAALDGCIQ